MIHRSKYLNALQVALDRSPVTALIGPRQSGKTTLARMVSENRPVTFFDLESPTDRQRLQNPELALEPLDGWIVLDEIQELPGLFAVLRVLADRPANRARFLILGSVAPELIRQAAETLAGRVEFVELAGFDLAEMGGEAADALWSRGGYPRSFLARSEADSLAWREGFVRTFLERDVPRLGIALPPVAMRRFWTMLAHYHGQLWNASELARSMGLSDKTVRSYLDILAGTFMIRQLLPWHANLAKRQVKAPKVYFRDSGLLHALLTIPDRHALLGHPKLGASWEGFALEQVLRAVPGAAAFFWATHAGAELDLLLMHGGRRFGFEFKFAEAPVATRSMRVARADLELAHLWIVHPGRHAFPVEEGISALPLAHVLNLAETMDAEGQSVSR